MGTVSRAFGRGGRTGTIESESGSYRHDVTLPGPGRLGVTPEELIAGAWIACFGATFIEIAEARKIDASDVEYEATICLEEEKGEYTITEASLEVITDMIEQARLDRLIDIAHKHCPVSKLLAGGSAAVRVRGARRVETARATEGK